MRINKTKRYKTVQVGNGQEKAQSERESHSKDDENKRHAENQAGNSVTIDNSRTILERKERNYKRTLLN